MRGMHTYCCDPVLTEVPATEWLCPSCVEYALFVCFNSYTLPLMFCLRLLLTSLVFLIRAL